MKFTTLLPSLVLATTNVLAAPFDELISRQIIPFNIALLNTSFCTNRYSTEFPNNGTACQIITNPPFSAFATTTIPASCTILAYPNTKCTGTNVITVPRDGSCFSFGNKDRISSLKVSGVCPGPFQS